MSAAEAAAAIADAISVVLFLLHDVKIGVAIEPG